MLARFIGKDGSMGFKNGEIYKLKSKCVNNKIIVKTANDKLFCPYESIESFLRNWEIKEN
nr:MAG TPA: hypothetical protein [Caudoviricetes sp.]